MKDINRIDFPQNLRITESTINYEELWKRKKFEKILKNFEVFLKKTRSVFPISIVYLIEGEGERYEN